MDKCRQEPPLLRQAVPMIRLTHSLLHLHLLGGCVDTGPSPLPTVCSQWLTANVSKAKPKSLRYIHLVFNKWHGQQVIRKDTHNPEQQPIWIKQAPDTPMQAPNTLQVTIDFAAITQTDPSFTSARRESTSALKMGHLKKLGIISPRHSLLPNGTPHGRR